MSNRICENCGQPVDPSFLFCLNCGHRLEMAPAQEPAPAPTPAPAPVPVAPPHPPKPVVMSAPVSAPAPAPDGKPMPMKADGFCGECGSRVRAGWLYCMQCGSPLMVAATQASSVTPPMPSTPPARPVPPAPPTPLQGRMSQMRGDQFVVQPGFVNTVSLADMDFGAINMNSGLSSADTSLGTAYDDWPPTDAGFPDDDAPTTVYDEDDDDALTMVYDEDEPQPTYVLTRAETGERLELDLPTTLGRGSKAETRITGNPFIGRIHARVYVEGDKVFVTDEGSANHTHVNGTMLSKGMPVELHDGDTLRLAKEDFAFSIEK